MLAQRYHPDVLAQTAKEAVPEAEKEESVENDQFIEVKAAFDRLIELNEASDGHLLADIELEREQKLWLETRLKQMQELRKKMADAKIKKDDLKTIELKKMEEEIKDQHRIKDLRRRDVVDRQLRYL